MTNPEDMKKEQRSDDIYSETNGLGDRQTRDDLSQYSLGHPLRHIPLDKLAEFHRDRFQENEDPNDLDQAILFQSEAISLYDAEHPTRDHSFHNLGVSYFLRFQRTGYTEDLDEAIKCLDKVLQLRSDGHSLRLASLEALASLLKTRFRESENAEDLDRAILNREEALTLYAPEDTDRDDAVHTLTEDLVTRFQRNHNIQNLDTAIHHEKELLPLRPPGHPARASCLESIAKALHFRYQASGDIHDIDENLRYTRESLEEYLPTHPDRIVGLNRLSSTLRARFQHSGDIQDIEDTISVQEESLALYDQNDSSRGEAMGHLAILLRHRSEKTGAGKDIDDAIRYEEKAIGLLPPNHYLLPTIFRDITLLLHVRYDHKGEDGDLDEIIRYQRQSVVFHPPGERGRHTFLDNFAMSLETRWSQRRHFADLDEAFHLREEACRSIPKALFGLPPHIMTLTGLARTLCRRYIITEHPEDVKAAIRYAEESLKFCSPDHPLRSFPLRELATSHHARFEKSNSTRDLEQATTYGTEAVQLSPPGHAAHRHVIELMACIHFHRFKHLGEGQSLLDSVAYVSELLELYPPGNPWRWEPVLSLLDRWEALQAMQASLPKEVHAQIIALLEKEVLNEHCDPRSRFIVAQRWATFARANGDPSAASAYSHALGLLDLSLALRPSLDSQHEFLAGHWQSLPLDAASFAIENGNLNNAVEILERGRGMLWSTIREYRQGVTSLRLQNEELADRFERTCNELESLATSSFFTNSSVQSLADTHPSEPSPVQELRWSKQRHLISDFLSIIQKIRTIEGFTDFLDTIPFQRLRQVAAEGPVIVINISSYRSDAIILLNDDLDTEPMLIPLSNSKDFPVELGTLSRTLQHTMSSDPIDDMAAIRRSSAVRDVVRQLWSLVVSPIVDKLLACSVPKGSRIWCCPTGALCNLPLHAAQPFVSGKPGLPDLFCFSYITTLSSLIDSRSTSSPDVISDDLPRMLAIGQEDESLPMVEEEVGVLMSFGDFVNLKMGEDARTSDILRDLPHYPWIHIACHGFIDPQPFNSSFQLYDGDRLRLIDIIAAHSRSKSSASGSIGLKNAELAFLSACHSAAGDSKGTPDEILHLAAAMQFVGYKSVVGTLWGMADCDGPALVRDFYERLLEGSTSISGEGNEAKRGNSNVALHKLSARALQYAVKQMRKRKVPLDRWVNFIHIGA